MILVGEIISYPETCDEHGVPRSTSTLVSSVSAFFTTLSGQCARACSTGRTVTVLNSPVFLNQL